MAGEMDPFPHVTDCIFTTVAFSTARLSSTCVASWYLLSGAVALVDLWGFLASPGQRGHFRLCSSQFCEVSVKIHQEVKHLVPTCKAEGSSHKSSPHLNTE